MNKTFVSLENAAGLGDAAGSGGAPEFSSPRRRVAILGSTGSIGMQTLDVIRKHSDKLEVVALAAGTKAAELFAQVREFGVRHAALGDELMKNDSVAGEMCDSVRQAGGTFGFGPSSVSDLVRLPEVDIVVNSLVGAAGLRASYEALLAGKVLALANKESLVVGGDLIMPLARRSDACLDAEGFSDSCKLTRTLMPIDSEHGAIYQCLLGEDAREVSRLWVTASGGPFRGKTRGELANITPEQALKHPTWNMGAKISIDSSTLMNKGLEVIEAHHLFDMPYDKIEVVVQPQSAIHSMVEFSDGSVKAHLGTTDMRIPIQFALSYPHRWEAPVRPIDFRTLGSLEFAAADEDTFRCLPLARHAGEVGRTLPCVMNAANEVAVAAFLVERCAYLDIAECVRATMDAHERGEAGGVQTVEDLRQLEELDRWARVVAKRWIEAR